MSVSPSAFAQARVRPGRCAARGKCRQRTPGHRQCLLRIHISSASIDTSRANGNDRPVRASPYRAIASRFGAPGNGSGRRVAGVDAGANTVHVRSRSSPLQPRRERAVFVHRHTYGSGSRGGERRKRRWNANVATHIFQESLAQCWRRAWSACCSLVSLLRRVAPQSEGPRLCAQTDGNWLTRRAAVDPEKHRYSRPLRL